MPSWRRSTTGYIDPNPLYAADGFGQNTGETPPGRYTTMIQQRLPRSTPEAEGLPSSAAEAFARGLDGLTRQGTRVHGYLLLRHGKVISEGYWSPHPADAPHQLFSLSKSFVSSAIGIAQGEGLLSIDDRLVDFFPERLTPKVTERMRRVTLRHLLTMSSGHASCALGRYRAGDVGHDWIGGFLEDELPYEPGTKFVYNSGATFVLSAGIQKVTGQPVSQYLRPRLFDPLGFGEVAWDRNPDGIEVGGWGMWTSVEEIAAFAQLWLQGGMWNGQQLIPRDYVAMASHKQIENAAIPWGGPPDWNQGYGFQFWMCRYNLFRGDGYAGQVALMMPEYDIAVAMTAGSVDIQAMLDVAYRSLMNAVKHRPLPEDKDALASLRAFESSLRHELAPPAGPKVGVAAASYRMEENPLGLRQVSIAPAGGGEGVELMLEFADRTATLQAGFHADTSRRTSLVYREPVEHVARAGWVSEQELVVNTLPVGTPSWFTLNLTFDGDRLTYRQRTPIWFRREDRLDVTVTGKRIPTA